MVALCGVIACAVILVSRQNLLPPAPAPVVAPAPPQPELSGAEKTAVPQPEAPKIIPAGADQSAEIPAATLAANAANPDDSTNSIQILVDALLSAKKRKSAMLDQLTKSGQLDQAIAALRQRAVDNPGDPGIPTTLGEALLHKLRDLHDSGRGDVNDLGILAMQADQSFNSALKLDPANYEALLVKSISQTFWPADPVRDGQVVQTLSGLIDRQETLAPQPDFAQTYLYLGNEYQKIGQPDKAMATWQLGLQKFPGDQSLLKKISGP